MADSKKAAKKDGADKDPRAGLMRIGEMAERLGVSARTLRYYEGLGLISPAHRRGKGYRYYDAGAMERVGRIQQMKRLGLPLDEIATALEKQFPQKDNKKAHKKAVKALEAQLQDTEAQMEALRDFRRKLKIQIAHHKGALKGAKG